MREVPGPDHDVGRRRERRRITQDHIHQGGSVIVPEVGIEEVAVLRVGLLEDRCRAPSTQQRAFGLEVDEAPHLSYAGIDAQRLAEGHEPAERCRVDRRPSRRHLNEDAHRLNESRHAHARERVEPFPRFGPRGPPVPRRESDPDPADRQREDRDHHSPIDQRPRRVPASVRAHFSQICGEWYQASRRASHAAGRCRGRGSPAGRGAG